MQHGTNDKIKRLYQKIKNVIKLSLNKMLQKVIIFFGEWTFLFSTIISRILAGFKSVNFVLYFLVVVVMLGGLGVWLEVFMNNSKELDIALLSFFMAIIASSSADLILKDKPKEEMRILKMPALSMLILCSIMAILIYKGVECKPNLAYTGAVLALLLWWITNSKDKKYKLNRAKAIGTVGGEIKTTNHSGTGENEEKQFEGIKH